MYPMEYTCTMNDTQFTTISITAVRVSIFSDHETSRLPDVIQDSSSMVTGFPFRATSMKITTLSRAEIPTRAEVTNWAPLSPI